MNATGSNALLSVLSLAVLLYLSYLYRQLRVDAFRQDMFILRDSLFDYAADHQIPFDHAAYGLLRNTMNGYIRYGHRLTLWQIVMFANFAGKADGPSFDTEWKRATAGLNENAKNRMEQYHNQMEWLVFKHVTLVTLELSVPLITAMLIRGDIRIGITGKSGQVPTGELLHEKFSIIDDTAMRYGQLV